MTTLPAPAPVTPHRLRDLRPAAVALFVLLVAAQIAIVVFQFWEPPFGGAIRYEDIAPISGALWPMNVLLGGPGHALGAVTTSIFLAVLGVGRGHALALTGAALYLVGGIVFALVITAEVLPFAWATDPAIVDEAQGRALFTAYNGAFDAFLPYILGSMAVVAVGALLAVIGAAVSGGLRWWVPVATLGLIVAAFAVPLDSPLAFPVDLVQRAFWIYVGWRGLRALTGRA